MKNSNKKDHSKFIIDILNDMYKSVETPKYQTRQPEIENHEQFMDFWFRKNDEPSGSRMQDNIR